MTEPSVSDDPLDFVQWGPADPDARFTPEPVDGRPTEWNGKPIPPNAMWEDDGVTPKLTPTGRIRRSHGPRKPRDTSTGTPRPAMTEAARNQLAQDLLDPIAKVAMGLSFTAPTVGAVLIERGEKTANAFVALAANSPRMLRALQRASKVGPAADLAETAVMLFVAIQLDTRSMAPTHPIAAITGVGALHMQVNPPTQPPGPTTSAPPPFTTDNGDVPPFTVVEEPTDPLDPRHSQYSFKVPHVPSRGGPFSSPFPPE